MIQRLYIFFYQISYFYLNSSWCHCASCWDVTCLTLLGLNWPGCHTSCWPEMTSLASWLPCDTGWALTWPCLGYIALVTEHCHASDIVTHHTASQLLQPIINNTAPCISNTPVLGLEWSLQDILHCHCPCSIIEIWIMLYSNSLNNLVPRNWPYSSQLNIAVTVVTLVFYILLLFYVFAYNYWLIFENFSPK